MLRNTDEGSGGGTRAGASDPGATSDELKRMVEAEVNEGGPPLPDPGIAPAEPQAPSRLAGAGSRQSTRSGPLLAPDEVVRLPLGADLSGSKSETLLKSGGFELIRLVVLAGKEIPTHKAPSELTVQCLEGLVSFTHGDSTQELKAGDLLHLCPGEPHSLKGLENASLLLTLRLPLPGK